MPAMNRQNMKKNNPAIATRESQSESTHLNFAQYKYHFPFPTHELKTANLREEKYANLSLDYSNEKLRILILNTPPAKI